MIVTNKVLLYVASGSSHKIRFSMTMTSKITFNRSNEFSTNINGRFRAPLQNIVTMALFFIDYSIFRTMLRNSFCSFASNPVSGGIGAPTSYPCIFNNALRQGTKLNF